MTIIMPQLGVSKMQSDPIGLNLVRSGFYKAVGYPITKMLVGFGYHIGYRIPDRVHVLKKNNLIKKNHR